jgi:hypothetical protein
MDLLKKPSSRRLFLLLFLGTFTLLVVSNWRFYFATPFHEQGDAAVNALQINHAKHFNEIYGNYSRFNFHHPGPAFFYVYALAEWMLCDAIPTGLPPGMVHSLAGLAVQSAFFALALSLAASWIRAPLFPALCLLAAAVHFGAAGAAFTSIWPPHVLLMPFLAFWVACISVAAGRGQHLPWLLLSGSFLVHGHAAQPLFVVVLFLCAYGGLVWSCWHAGEKPLTPWLAFRREHFWSLAIFLLFLFPIALDLLHGNESNFSEMIRILRNREYDHKSLTQSFFYFLSFFAYLHNQDILFGTPSSISVAFLRDHLWLYIAWLAALGLTLITLGGLIGNLRRETRRVLWIMLAFWTGAAGLCLRWGVMQSGSMYDFNGYFYYSIIYGLLLMFCAFLAEAIRWPRPRWIGGALFAAAAFIGAYRLNPSPVSAEDLGVPIREATMAILRADPRPAAPKLLVFSHDDWPVVAAAALALERAGATFYVGGVWSFMFERKHVLPESLLVDPHANLSVWRFVRSQMAGSSERFTNGIRIYFQPAALSPDDGLIDFSRTGNLDQYTLCGFTTPDGDSVWTDQPHAALQFRPLPATRDVELRMEVSPFLASGKRRNLTEQPVEVSVDGVTVSTAQFTKPGVLRALIPKDLWNRNPTALLYLHLPNARSPLQFGFSGDPRMLSLEVTRLTTRPALP